MKRTLGIIIVLGLALMVIAGCQTQKAQTQQNALPQAQQPTSPVNGADNAIQAQALPGTDVPADIVGSNPDTGSVDAPAVDTSNLT